MPSRRPISTTSSGCWGARPHDWRDGEAKLEAFVRADTAGHHDTELVRLFHKRNLRAQMLLGPANSAMTHHHAIQKFRPASTKRRAVAFRRQAFVL